MNKLIFLVGIPGSGKSSYAQKKLAKKCKILSSDLIREELFNDINNQSNNSLVFNTLYQRAKEYLSDKKDVVIDATNINIVERKKALDHFKDFNVKRVAIVFDVPASVCIERDAKRNRTVGAKVINRFAKIFVKPTLIEGFNEIIYIN